MGTIPDDVNRKGLCPDQALSQGSQRAVDRHVAGETSKLRMSRSGPLAAVLQTLQRGDK